MFPFSTNFLLAFETVHVCSILFSSFHKKYFQNKSREQSSFGITIVIKNHQNL